METYLMYSMFIMWTVQKYRLRRGQACYAYYATYVNSDLSIFFSTVQQPLSGAGFLTITFRSNTLCRTLLDK